MVVNAQSISLVRFLVCGYPLGIKTKINANYPYKLCIDTIYYKICHFFFFEITNVNYILYRILYMCEHIFSLPEHNNFKNIIYYINLADILAYQVNPPGKKWPTFRRVMLAGKLVSRAFRTLLNLMVIYIFVYTSEHLYCRKKLLLHCNVLCIHLLFKNILQHGWYTLVYSERQFI